MKLQKLRFPNRAKLWGILLPLFIYSSLFGDAHIFVYHRFGDSRHPTTDTSLKELRKEFNYFKNNGYKVIPLKRLVKALKEKKSIDDRWVVLTIDDNFKSFYTNALPLFREFGYPFTIFVYVEATNKRYPDYTTWEQLKEIAKYGEIGFHSYSHPHMTFKSDDFLRSDFTRGLSLIKKHLGIVPKYFAYPYGEFNTRVKKIAKEFNFEAILNQNIGAVSKNSDIYDLDRNALVGKSNLKRDLLYKELSIEWLEPKSYPTNGILKKIMAKLPSKNIKSAGCYISGYGWHKVIPKDGLIDDEVGKKLLLKRSRIVISVKNRIKTKLLIKDKYGGR